MSSKSSKGSNKAPKSATREMADIQQSYAETMSKAAQAQYLVYVHTQSLKELNEQLLLINQEAAARQALDASKAGDTNEQA